MTQIENKTFEQYCDEVAKKYYLKNWSYVYLSWLHNNWDLEKVTELEKEAAELYAKSQKAIAWEEGYNDGSRGGQSDCAGYPQKAVNPYKP